MKIYHYQCKWCFFNIDDEQRMINHCLKLHGSTGQFKKGYKILIRYKRKTINTIKTMEHHKEDKNMENEITQVIKPEIISEIKIRYKRHYLRNGKQAPTGVKAFITEKSGKQYVMKEIGKKNGYIME